jgi:hypothetical protein
MKLLFALLMLLCLQVVRPRTYAGDLALTAHQRSIKGLAQVRQGVSFGVFSAPNKVATLLSSPMHTARQYLGATNCCWLAVMQLKLCNANPTAAFYLLLACLQGIIDDLLNSALAHIAMRPTKQQVAVEVAEWKAARPAALAGISRHVADRCGMHICRTRCDVKHGQGHMHGICC